MLFLTGLISHVIQRPVGWLSWPSRPAGLYRVTQGVHVATGLASIPLLLAKLWVMYPHFWTWPPVRDIAHAVERLSLVPLVGGSLFMLFTGLANVGLWYPWNFFFPTGHFWGAWITIGALVVHIGAKLALTRSALFGARDEPPTSKGGISRRSFLSVIAGTTGLVTLTTIGQTIGPLKSLGILAPRDPTVGPQGFPVNQSAAEAAIARNDVGPDYRMEVTGGVTNPLVLSLEDLRGMPQHEVILPIACVEGWSASVRWRGVRVIDVLAQAGASPDATVTVESLQKDGIYRTSELNSPHAHDSDTLLALEANCSILDIDHGYPVRLIGPNRPGVMQTKWIAKLVVA